MTTATISKTNTAFPGYLEDLRALMPELVEILEAGGERYGFAFLEEKITRQVNIQRTESNHTEVDRGMVLRIVAGGRNFESATNELDADNLRRAARELSARVDRELSDGATVPAYTPLAWSAELAGDLPDVVRKFIPETVSAATPVHFSVPCQLDPFATDSGALTERARELRAIVEARDVEYRDSPNRVGRGEALAAVAVTVRQSLTTHVFVDREKNMSQTLPISMAIVRGATTGGAWPRASVDAQPAKAWAQASNAMPAALEIPVFMALRYFFLGRKTCTTSGLPSR